MNFIEKLQNDFNEKNHHYKLRIHCKNLKSENFSLNLNGREILLNADNLLGATFGVSLSKAGILSGHLIEYLGSYASSFPIRALWIKNLEAEFLWNENYSEELCQRTLLLGYNTLIFEFQTAGTKEFITSFKNVIKKISSYGLKIAVKICGEQAFLPGPASEEYEESLISMLSPILDHLGAFDYLFWEAKIDSYLGEGKNRQFLMQDVAKIEAKKLEKITKDTCQLIYFLPAKDNRAAEKQSRFILSLSHELSPKTCIAFSSQAGSLYSDFCPPHPLWEILRRRRGSSFANFLPVVNVGLIGHGEGLWPTFTFDLSQRLSRCDPSLFSGAIALTANLPKENALLSCSLWTAAFTLLEGKKTPFQLAETWFEAYFPSILKYHNFDKLLEEIRNVSIMISHLSFLREDKGGTVREEYRLLAESLLLRLKVLEIKVSDHAQKEDFIPDFKNYFTFFVRDSRRLILRFLQQHQMPIVNVLNEDDRQESFWTSIPASGIKSSVGSPVLLREQPFKGEPGSLMNKIYEDNTCFFR